MNGRSKSKPAPGPMTSSICHAARVEAARIAGYLKSWNIWLSSSRSEQRNEHGSERQAGKDQRTDGAGQLALAGRSEEHTSELQSLMRISYAVFCLKKKK